MSPADERQLISVMPLHTITAVYGEQGLRDRLALEAGQLTEAASRLFRTRARPNDMEEMDGALLFNLRLWNILVADMIEPDNPLPPEIKQNLYNLFLFVDKRTVEIVNSRRIEMMDALISINREIARGLTGQSAE